MATTPNTSQFGDLIQGLQQLSSLFGGQSREQSQQFSTGQVGDQAIAANSAATQAGLNTLGLQKDAAGYGAALNRDAYQNKSGTDLNQALQMKNLNAPASASSSSMQGAGASNSPYTPASLYGGPLVYDAQADKRWQSDRNQALQSTAMFGQVQSNVDVSKAKKMAAIDIAKNAALSDRDRYNQALLSQQQATQQLNAQSGQLAAQKEIAATQAQGNIISSLFGSVGIGANQNRKYWN
jgi:hypothetical protein